MRKRLLFALCCAILASCQPAELQRIEDASDKRAVICRFVEAWTQDRPELSEVRDLCRAGADLREIAAAYAGCRVPD